MACYLTFPAKLDNYGFRKSFSDEGLFPKITPKDKCIRVALCVDDLLVSVENVLEIDEFKTYMRDVARIKIKI